MIAPSLDELAFRRPVEADYPRVIEVVDEWWGGRKMRALLPRLWLQHFSGTSWLLETPGGRLAGFAIAFISQDDPTTGYVHMIAADPNWRRAGIGRTLYERVFDDLAEHGVRRVKAITWPGNRTSVAFHTAIGFRVDDGPGTQRLYGTPAHADYDGWGEDRVVFTRDL
jgi:ribosomal protein S18 acetylase RimI-like enzyme